MSIGVRNIAPRLTQGRWAGVATTSGTRNGISARRRDLSRAYTTVEAVGSLQTDTVALSGSGASLQTVADFATSAGRPIWGAVVVSA